MGDYKQKYKEALKRARQVHTTNVDENKKSTEYIFPELKESKDDIVRNRIIAYLKQDVEEHPERKERICEMLDWLEKQGYQKPTNKIEPKFKVGDFIVSDYCMGKVIELTNDAYLLDSGQGIPFSCEHIVHLWTILDAKDGDVLVCGAQCHGEKIEQVGIYKVYIGRHGGCSTSFKIYAGIDWNKHLLIDDTMGSSEIYPATKEQRDLLFSKMKEAGYEWDSEKKELRKIEQKPEINDNVLSRFAFYQYDNDTIYLSSVFVEECNRKRGYGSKILKAAEEVAKTLGISKIRLKVERNTWMEEWYKKNGYEYLSPDGEYNWLEKRVEQKPVDKVEPEFNVGDWVVPNNGEPRVFMVEERGWPDSIISDPLGNQSVNTFTLDKQYHLWTIQDAKDGDVLYHKSPLTGIEYIVMSRGINGYGNVDSYFRYNSADGFGINVLSVFDTKKDNITPATKEQRDLLFQKMKEAGYEWDSEKKELKRINLNKAEHGKYYYCIKDYFSGGKKFASKGDVVLALRGLPIMGLEDISEYFLPVTNIQKPAEWSEEDEEMIVGLNNCLDELEEVNGWRYTYVNNKDVELDKLRNRLKSLKERHTWKPSDEQMEFLWKYAEQNNYDGTILASLFHDLKKLKS